MTYAIDLLPEYIRNVVLSDEYMDFMGETAQEYNFSETQCDELNRLALYILVKEIDIHNLINIVKQEFNLNDDQSKALAMKLILNIVLPFPDHFGDESEYYKQLGGDVDDLYASKVLDVLMNNTSQALDEIMAPYHNLDINKEAEDMKLMFANDLVEVFYAPEEYMVKFMRGLNNTLFYILSKVENLHQQLVYALYENKDTIGTQDIMIDDNYFEPTASNWIQDYIKFSFDTISTVTLGKYLSHSPNVKHLNARRKEVLKKILKTYVVLRNYPASLDEMTPENLMIIPYSKDDF